MPRKRTSPIWTIPKPDLVEIVNSSRSRVEILAKLNLDPYTGNHRTLNLRLKEDSISLIELDQRAKKWRTDFVTNVLPKTNSLSTDRLFCENSTVDRKIIKSKILQLGLIEKKCSSCAITDTYNGLPISLQLDHINGTNDDNRLSNLRFLCPNCHSQTETFSGKKRKRQMFCACGEKIHKKSTICRSCSQQKRTKINWPPKEELVKMLEKHSSVEVGKMLGVSDTAVRKHCRKAGVVMRHTRRVV
jgi:5-methylcytosine-specific restriction endonuclease McrA